MIQEQGKYVDARDATGQWYAAMLKEVYPDGGMAVHYMGWSPRFDDVIPSDQREERIAPLYSKSPDRRTWCAEGQIEVKLLEEEGEFGALWIPASIMEVDSIGSRVQIQYITSEEKQTKLKKGRTCAQRSDDDSAALKKSPSSSSDTTTKEYPVMKWFEVLSDHVCPYGTHFKKQHAAVDRHTSASEASSVDNNHNTVSGTGGGAIVSSISTLSHLFTKPFQTLTSAANYSFGDRHVKGAPDVPGAVGLQNLGNTCFMNSILQCLSNTKPLTDLFFLDRYLEDLNKDNKLGHGGKLASSYAKLVHDMWCNEYTRLVPREFKAMIGEFQPQFAGYEQHDSQEFLGFLLDGLHEDLNRVAVKPMVTKIESKGRDDALIASESWRRYLLRNDSALIDSCFGQLKSHVTCTSCGSESVTFDEYSSLSLPLPVRSMQRSVIILLSPLPIGSAPVKLTLEVDVTMTMADLSTFLLRSLQPYKVLIAAATNENDFNETVAESDYSPLSEVHTDEAPNSPAAGSMSSSSTAGSHRDARVFFHFATIENRYPSCVARNYSRYDKSSSSKNISVCSFVGKGETLAAFQLQHAVPDIIESQFSSIRRPAAAASHSSCSAGGDDERSRPDCGGTDSCTIPAAIEYFAVDVCTGFRTVISSTFSSHERIDLVGHPTRITVRRKCTNREVLRSIYAVMRRYFREDSICCKAETTTTTDLLKMPYQVLVTNHNASIVRHAIDYNDEIFEIDNKQGKAVLCVVWQRDSDDLDVDQIDFVRTITTTIASSSSSSSDTASSSSVSSDSATGRKLSIYECFDKFCEREQLAETETLLCSHCKQHLAPIKKMDIWSAPDILILQLKRFLYVPGQYVVRREKLNDMVDFPVDGLDLSRYVIGPQQSSSPPLYDLYAVSHHSGSLSGGHYTATCKNFFDLKWYSFNDSSVAVVGPEHAVSSTAYVLFYQRRGGTLRWGGAVPTTAPLPDK